MKVKLSTQLKSMRSLQLFHFGDQPGKLALIYTSHHSPHHLTGLVSSISQPEKTAVMLETEFRSSNCSRITSLSSSMPSMTKAITNQDTIWMLISGTTLKYLRSKRVTPRFIIACSFFVKILNSLINAIFCRCIIKSSLTERKS